MKRLIIILFAMALSFTDIQAQDTVASLWDKFREAEKAGKPQTAASYLIQLESEAVSKGDRLERLYIGEKLYNTLSKYNWKEANQYHKTYSEVRRSLMDNLEGSISEYSAHPRIMILLYEQLNRRRNEVYRKGEKATGEDWKAIRAQCEKLLKQSPPEEYRQLLKDDIARLDRKELQFTDMVPQTAPGGSVRFHFESVNLARVQVSLYRIKNENLQPAYGNEKEMSAGLRKNCTLVSEYTIDTLRNEYSIRETAEGGIVLTDAGCYLLRISSGSTSDYQTINCSSIAGAGRVRDGKIELYAADIVTGRPFEEIDVSVFNGSGKPASGFASLRKKGSRHCSLEGFTDSGIGGELLDDSSCQIRLENGGDKGSPLMNFYLDSELDMFRKREIRQRTVYSIFTDRALYKKDDTIRFKVICDTRDGLSGQVVCNKAFEITLRHQSDDKAVAKMSLTTNDMGSASGCFTLPEGARNGQYILSIDDSGYKTVRVENYERPTFEIVMETDALAHCFGDMISQKGKVESYAGYPVAGCKVEYGIVRRNFPRAPHFVYFSQEKIASGTAETDSEGIFHIDFSATRPDMEKDGRSDGLLSASFIITAKVTDPRGETHESSCSVPVADIPLDLEIGIESSRSFKGNIVVDKLSTSSFKVKATTLNGNPFGINGTYELWHDGRLYRKDSFNSNSDIACWFEDLPSGTYTIKASAQYRGRAVSTERKILVLSYDDTKIPVEDDCFCYQIQKEGSIDFLIGTSEEDLYLNLEILDGETVLHREAVHLQNEMRRFRFPFLKQYGSAVTVELFGFRSGREIHEELRFTNPETVHFTPKFSFFRDRTAPDNKEHLVLNTAPESETVLSIFDVTTDRYGKNSFKYNPVNPFVFEAVPDIRTTVEEVRLYGRNMLMSKAAGIQSMEDMVGYSLANESAAVIEEDAAREESPQEELRADFSGTLGFFPHLRAGKDSTVVLEYTSNGLLGKFRVLAMSHTKDLKTGLTEKSFIVQKPLMVVPSLPLSVMQEDVISLKASIVNVSDKALEGTASIEITDQDGRKINWKGLGRKKIAVDAGSQAAVSWEFEVPDAEVLKVKIVYSDGQISDGELNSIRVIPASATITEAASFVIGSENGFEYWENTLKKKYGRFKPSFSRAEYSTLDAVKESLPEASAPENDNAVEWMNQLYISQMRSLTQNVPQDMQFRGQAFAKLSDLQSSDGGFKWFGGMRSSETVTLYILEKIFQMKEAGAIALNSAEKDLVMKALAYVDELIENTSRRKGHDFFSDIRLMSVRSRWFEVPLSKEAEKVFPKFLDSTKDGWQDISILQKAQLCRILQRCEGTSLWKGSFRLRIDRLAESLADYAVANKTVGCYFPNAVTPFRGLMNSEIYAHSALMEVFSSLGRQDMVKGIAQWLLLQKHNQAWENTVATTDAVHALVTSKAPDLRLGAVYCTYSASYKDIEASANELSVERTYTRRSDSRRIEDGDTLNVGDEIIATYLIHNSENRSFVRLKAMRPASFYPQDERSQYSWGGFFREVKESCTEYYWELLPEEETTVIEKMYVTKEGVFNSGIAEIESLYASEYRGHSGAVTSVRSK